MGNYEKDLQNTQSEQETATNQQKTCQDKERFAKDMLHMQKLGSK